MKRLIIALFILPVFAHSQTPQSDRWALLYEDKATNTKNYVDIKTIEFLDNFEIQQKVCLIWVRSYHDYSGGIYHQQDDQHIAIALDAKQYGIKSYTNRKDGTITSTKQFLMVQWSDIEPETVSEFILNYCKALRK